ncbi:MAG: 50S ribosomal protein L6 [Candidatus Berkelbacteria bacterium]|nr:50S ribosomal protein L6 [Candidatus Berkelbacteria bacterium]
MSRIGSKIIVIPEDVKVSQNEHSVCVEHNSNKMVVEIHPFVEVKIDGSTVSVTRKNDSPLARSLHGLTRTLINNAIVGLKDGFEKKLEIIGVGYRANVEGDVLNLKVGFSHEIKISAPQGIVFEVKKNTIIIKGYDKQLVGQMAAQIRDEKKPEPYKGKGIKYEGEKIIRKIGKAVKGSTTGA